MAREFLRIKTSLHELGRKVVSLIDYGIWLAFDTTKFKRIDSSSIKKILIVLINQEKGNVGGNFATLGVLNCFKKYHPKVDVAILADKRTVRQFDEVNKIRLIEYKGKETLGKIRKEGFDAVLILTPGDLTPFDLSFIPYRIGYTHLGISGFFRRKKLGYTRKVYNKMNQHMVELRFKMLEALGFKFKQKKPFLEFTKLEEENVRKLLRRHKIKKFIIIHPGGKYVAEFYRRGRWTPHLWNLDRYAKVADYFAKKGYKIIITGSKDEEILTYEIIKNAIQKQKIISVCGKLSVRETGALLKKASCLIATDTAVVHIAYQIGVPVVELMGPSIPEVVGAWPLNSKKHKILVDRGPCYRSMRKLPFSDNFNCLKNIKTEDVIRAGEELIHYKEK
ncbi:MAG: glycosyltransferase family 9 protein [Nanoarchaeota archaeon]|nr:glycosyltransferase family 9 protein [Nanoarchaeota archaeon]